MPDERRTSSDELLHVAPEFTLRAHGHLLRVEMGGRSYDTDSRIFGVLSAFARPRSLRDALEHLEAHGSQGFLETSSLILRMREEGLLTGAAPEPARQARGYDAPSIHVAMLDDVTRTKAFLRALRETVRPGDVVVEIGTGTGILAVEAARAGAARVYAIEAASIADAALAMVERNGVADVVRVVRGWSTEVDLPERCDVLVSEMLGNDPLAEQILALFADAKRRFLRPDARLIPSVVDVFVLPVDVPSDYVAEHIFTEGRARRWGDLYGIDFDALPAWSKTMERLPAQKPQAMREWTQIADPIRIAHIDLSSFDGRVVASTAQFVAKLAAKNLGFIEYFECSLSKTSSLSTSPMHASDDNHWTCVLFRAAERSSVEADEEVHVELSNVGGSTTVRAR